VDEKKRLLNRVRRIIGQVAAIEKTLNQEGECAEVLGLPGRHGRVDGGGN
jgi:DNA-binding FrmR family transcriptional regulator